MAYRHIAEGIVTYGVKVSRRCTAAQAYEQTSIYVQAAYMDATAKSGRTTYTCTIFGNVF
jgi:hypothetical protein